MTVRLVVHVVVDIPEDVFADGLTDDLAAAEQAVRIELANDLRLDEWTVDGATVQEFTVTLRNQ